MKRWKEVINRKKGLYKRKSPAIQKPFIIVWDLKVCWHMGQLGNPEICIFFNIVCSSFSKIYKSLTMIPSPLCPSPPQCQGGTCGRRRGCTPPSSTCQPPGQVWPISMDTKWLSFHLKCKEENELTAIPARIRLMWLLRMSAWLRTCKSLMLLFIFLARPTKV